MEDLTDNDSMNSFLSEESDIGRPIQELIERHKIEKREEAKYEHIFLSYRSKSGE